MTRQRVLLRDALASTPGDVARLVRRLDADAAGPVLAHLVAVEETTVTNLRLAAGTAHPVLADEHDQLDGTGQHDPPAGRHEPVAPPDPGQLLRRFEAARHETLGHLDVVPDAGWSRAVYHRALGTTRLITVIRRLLDHDLVHLGALADARRRTPTDPQPEHVRA